MSLTVSSKKCSSALDISCCVNALAYNISCTLANSSSKSNGVLSSIVLPGPKNL